MQQPETETALHTQDGWEFTRRQDGALRVARYVTDWLDSTCPRVLAAEVVVPAAAWGQLATDEWLRLVGESVAKQRPHVAQRETVHA